MAEIKITQYMSQRYPLARYYIQDIPLRIMQCIKTLNDNNIAIIRGGLSYIILTKDNSYMLKDIDLLGKNNSKDLIIENLYNADEIYVNKNNFNRTVITAFWKRNEDYFKIDVLLSDDTNDCDGIIDKETGYKTVTHGYLLRARIKKIAQRLERKHSVEKTINHYNVSKKLSIYMLENNIKLNDKDIEIIKEFFPQTMKVVRTVLKIDKLEADAYKRRIDELSR